MLWTLRTDTVSLYHIHPHRSKEAFEALIEDWQGILVSDGYDVYQTWVHFCQTCLAYLIRSARGLWENGIVLNELYGEKSGLTIHRL